jgi:mannose-6-phosphate isomerase
MKDNYFETRPWGSFEVLGEFKGCKVKRLEVLPGKRLSLQRHSRRAETWVVVSGVGLFTIGQREVVQAGGSVLEIPVSEMHRITNEGGVPLVIIEVQRGDYLGEDDIERFQDDFGRTLESIPG